MCCYLLSIRNLVGALVFFKQKKALHGSRERISGVTGKTKSIELLNTKGFENSKNWVYLDSLVQGGGVRFG